RLEGRERMRTGHGDTDGLPDDDPAGDPATAPDRLAHQDEVQPGVEQLGDLRVRRQRVHADRVERFVSLPDVLPVCALVVCHRGAGTTLAALAHAVPVVVL